MKRHILIVTKEQKEKLMEKLKGRPSSADGKISVRGQLTAIARRGDGSILWEKDLGSNIVVDTGLDVYARAIVGNSHPINTISELRFGDGATGGSPDAAPGDTDLTNTIRSRAFDTVSFPSTGVVVVAINLDTATGNGETYNEAGLFTNDSPGVLVARKVFADISKTSAFSLEFRYTLTHAV